MQIPLIFPLKREAIGPILTPHSAEMATTHSVANLFKEMER